MIDSRHRATYIGLQIITDAMLWPRAAGSLGIFCVIHSFFVNDVESEEQEHSSEQDKTVYQLASYH